MGNNTRVVITLATQKRWRVKHLDTKKHFLDGMLKEEVYMY
jgi:hypothetical protein